MSQGAVKARKDAARIARANERADAELHRIEADAALDAVLVRCVICGLEQVASGMEPAEGPTQGCFRCGSRVGTFVELLPGHAWYARAQRGSLSR